MRAAATVFLATLTFCALPAPALAGRPLLCVVHRGAVEGLAPDVLAVALAIERRKTGLDGEVVSAAGVEACGNSPVLAIGGARDAELAIGGAVQPLDVAGVMPEDRAQDVARRAMATVAGSWPAGRVPIVRGDLPRLVPPPIPSPVEPEVRGALRGYGQVGGRYEYATKHAGVAELEAGIAMLDERLAFGARLAWRPPRELGGEVPARVQAVAAGLMVRGGFRPGPLLLRAGVGVGVEWTRLATSPPTRLSTPIRSATAPVIEGEAEVVWPAGRWLRISAAVLGRGFPTWQEWKWAGRTLFWTPRMSGGVAVRIGVVFP